MQERFDRIMKGLLPNGGAVLLAVSGGIDSMCMADLFLNSLTKVSFALAHCNFHLRGSESDSDEALVREWAERHGIIFIKKDFDTRGYAASKGISIEMAARELRYGWFAEVCSERKFSALAVAHNANDNAETMILNMLRGTGVKGMTGMRRSSLLPGSDTRLIRPLLDFPRKDIHEYAVSHGLRWHEDSTNADSAYKRNCIRNEIFPLFERLNPSFLTTLNEDMERFAQVQSIADEYVRSVSAEVVRSGSDGLPVVDHKRLTLKKNWEYVLFRLLEPFGFSSSVVADLAAVLKSRGTVSGRKFFASEYVAVTSATGIRVIRSVDFTDGHFGGTDGHLFCSTGGHFDKLSDRAVPVAELAASVAGPAASVAGPAASVAGLAASVAGPAASVAELAASVAELVEATDVTIEGPGIYSLDGVKISVSLSDDVRNVRTVPGETKFDTAKIPFPFTVRHWRSGDWMRPLGMKGRKKLSDMFVDLKFSLPEKEIALVIADEGSHVLALIGHRIDDSVKVTEESTSVTVIRII